MLNKQTAIIIKWLETKATDDDKQEILNWIKANPTTALRDTVLIDLIKKGQALQAVKYYQDQKGCDIKTAKEFIDTIKANLAYDQEVQEQSALMSTSNLYRPHVKLDINGVAKQQSSAGILEQINHNPKLNKSGLLTSKEFDMLEQLKQKFGK